MYKENLNKILRYQKQSGINVEEATEIDINKLKKIFSDEFDIEIPKTYCEILKMSNGLIFYGFEYWSSNLLEKNKILKDYISNDSVYFAKWEDIYFIYNKIEKEYRALNISSCNEDECIGDECGLLKKCPKKCIQIWEKYKDFDEMIWCFFDLAASRTYV